MPEFLCSEQFHYRSHCTLGHGSAQTDGRNRFGVSALPRAVHRRNASCSHARLPKQSPAVARPPVFGPTHRSITGASAALARAQTVISTSADRTTTSHPRAGIISPSRGLQWCSQQSSEDGFWSAYARCWRRRPAAANMGLKHEDVVTTDGHHSDARGGPWKLEPGRGLQGANRSAEHAHRSAASTVGPGRAAGGMREDLGSGSRRDAFDRPDHLIA